MSKPYINDELADELLWFVDNWIIITWNSRFIVNLPSSERSTNRILLHMQVKLALYH